MAAQYARCFLETRWSRSAISVGVSLGLMSLVGVGQAVAANPACSSGFVTSVVHVTADDHFRGKACYKEATDNWQFQDTYADGWSINFYYRPNSLKGDDLGAGDWDGWNQKWKTQ